MRTFLFGVFCLLALTGVLWIVRPAALGDAGGLWAMVDNAVPAAAGWRANLVQTGSATGSLTTAASAKSEASTSAKPLAGKAKPPVVVLTQPVTRKTLEVAINAVGTVQAVASIVIKPRADSQIVAVPVAEGAAVKAGDVLFKLDDTALKAQLAQSDAQIAKDKAQLEQNKRDLTRNEDLLKQKFIAPQVLETTQTTFNQTQAQIGVDEAQRNAIATSIGYMTITSAISGRIGSIAAKPGAAVKAGDTLATVNQIDPIYVTFAVPQDRLGDLRTAMASGKAIVKLRSDPKAPTGTIAFIENSVDSATGTITVKASMPNAAEKLWPGAFANVSVVTGSEDNALVVPSIAVQIGQKGNYVFTAKDGKSLLKAVEVERVVGDDTVITSGLEAGDAVVVQGQTALSDGADITIGKPSAPASDKAKDTKAAGQG